MQAINLCLEPDQDSNVAHSRSFAQPEDARPASSQPHLPHLSISTSAAHAASGQGSSHLQQPAPPSHLPDAEQGAASPWLSNGGQQGLARMDSEGGSPWARTPQSAHSNSSPMAGSQSRKYDGLVRSVVEASLVPQMLWRLQENVYWDEVGKCDKLRSCACCCACSSKPALHATCLGLVGEPQSWHHLYKHDDIAVCLFCQVGKPQSRAFSMHCS